MRFVVIALVLALTSSIARADKVAVFDSDRLYVKGGIARWLAAKAKFDDDRKKPVLERPDSKPIECNEPLMGEAQCKRVRQIEAGRRAKAEQSALERSTLEAIETEVAGALVDFCKARGITVVFEREETMIYVAATADITDAFIKEFNAKPVPKKK
jgi:Skp family chaperone for outer membrane proteins